MEYMTNHEMPASNEMPNQHEPTYERPLTIQEEALRVLEEAPEQLPKESMYLYGIVNDIEYVAHYMTTKPDIGAHPFENPDALENLPSKYVEQLKKMSAEDIREFADDISERFEELIDAAMENEEEPTDDYVASEEYQELASGWHNSTGLLRTGYAQMMGAYYVACGFDGCEHSIDVSQSHALEIDNGAGRPAASPDSKESLRLPLPNNAEHVLTGHAQSDKAIDLARSIVAFAETAKAVHEA